MTASRHLDQLEQRSRIMPSGDYQIQVHLIECRDLTGLHDPYVRVKVMGRVKKTRVIRKVSACVFDDTLQFNFAGLSCSAIEEASIEVKMYDFDAFLAHDLIGATVFDARSVRELPNHEFYRKWVGLTNSQSNANRSKDNCAAVHRGIQNTL
jgi:Ca2+-dependent lipid-binding protein|mmetsp:Transcript_9048/g.23673  ORF Transcript_9048/g.23673 Transcript_9048/m.23673 type:complete len:152 (+) Transcript_9048:1658-2113(+)